MLVVKTIQFFFRRISSEKQKIVASGRERFTSNQPGSDVSGILQLQTSYS